MGSSSPLCPACAFPHVTWWHLSVVRLPELLSSSSPPLTAQKISWLSTRQCCACLGEGSLEGGGQKALCEGRDGVELTLVAWPEGLSTPASHQGSLGEGASLPSALPLCLPLQLCLDTAKPYVCFSLFPLSAGRKRDFVHSCLLTTGLTRVWSHCGGQYVHTLHIPFIQQTGDS